MSGHDHTHHHGKSCAEAAANLASRGNAAWVSLAVGVGMLGGKWVAYLTTGSSAILSDAMESIVHVVATLFAFASIYMSARPPDPKYPYGYGKISYFSAGFEGALIVLAALAICYEAVEGLILNQPLRKPEMGLLLIGIASVVNLALGLWLIARGRQTDSLILIADGQHVLSDSYTSFAVVFGVALVWLTGIQWLDPVVALLVAANIIRTGYSLARSAITGLMDRSDPALLERICKSLDSARQPGWLDLHHLRAWQAGDRTFVDFHLVVPPDWTVCQLHDASHACLDALRGELGSQAELIVHFDPGHASTLPHGTGPDSPWTADRAVLIPADDHVHAPHIEDPVAEESIQEVI